jgi:hypothetical protein
LEIDKVEPLHYFRSGIDSKGYEKEEEGNVKEL